MTNSAPHIQQLQASIDDPTGLHSRYVDGLIIEEQGCHFISKLWDLCVC